MEWKWFCGICNMRVIPDNCKKFGCYFICDKCEDKVTNFIEYERNNTD